MNKKNMSQKLCALFLSAISLAAANSAHARTAIISSDGMPDRHVTEISEGLSKKGYEIILINDYEKGTDEVLTFFHKEGYVQVRQMGGDFNTERKFERGAIFIAQALARRPFDDRYFMLNGQLPKKQKASEVEYIFAAEILGEEEYIERTDASRKKIDDITVGFNVISATILSETEYKSTNRLSIFPCFERCSNYRTVTSQRRNAIRELMQSIPDAN